MSKITDLTAKLLAAENIKIIRSDVETASFDLETRTLYKPMWKDMSQEVEDLLLSHEVGHALFTHLNEIEHIFNNEKHLIGYVNVLEDVRVEKFMKQRYPGLRKVFSTGYNELHMKDFFGLSKRDLDELILIDRINVFCKIGVASGVNFTHAEFEYVNRAVETKTLSDVIALAKEIYNLTKDKVKQTKDEEQTVSVSESNQDSGNGDVPEPVTYDTFNKNLSSSVVNVTEYKYYKPSFVVTYDKPILSYRDLMLDAGQFATRIGVFAKYKSEDYAKFVETNNMVVSYMVKEFEMRKAAAMYKRKSTSKTGLLDLKKLYAYKYKDDIFKQIVKVQDEKNHSMVFLLDLSRSMVEYILQTMEQLITLMTFCRRVRIPFSVFSFTSHSTLGVSFDKAEDECNQEGISTNKNLVMLKLFDDKMTAQEYDYMCKLMYCEPKFFYDRSILNMGTTPLNEALITLNSLYPDLLKQFNTDKNTLVVLSDGASDESSDFTNTPIKPKSGFSIKTHKNQSTTPVIFDSVTKKEYVLSKKPASLTESLMKLVKDRYDLKLIRFYVCPASMKPITEFINYNLYGLPYAKVKSAAELIMQKLKDDSYCEMGSICSCDNFFIIRTTGVKDADVSSINGNLSVNKMAERLTTILTKSKNSRTVLTKFIEEIS